MQLEKHSVVRTIRSAICSDLSQSNVGLETTGAVGMAVPSKRL